MVSRWILTRLAPALLVAACSLENPGDEPPRGELYFPTTLSLSECPEGDPTCASTRRLLFVGNSNFDLRYNAGSIQAFDLSEVDARLDRCQPDEECIVSPADVLVDEVLVGTFISALGHSSTALYVASRSDQALTYIELGAPGDDRLFECGQGRGRRCSDSHLRGDERVASERGLSWPGEAVGLVVTPASAWDNRPTPLPPVAMDDDAGTEDAGVDVSSDDGEASSGDAVIVAHRGGAVSLFLPDGDGPQLTHVLAGLRQDLTGIAYDDTTQRAYLSVNEAQGVDKRLYRIGVAIENSPDPLDAFLYASSSLALQGVALGADTRAIGFMQPSEDIAHLRGRALVVGRQPSSLMVVDVESGMPTTAPVRRTIEVGQGASRVARGRVAGREIAAVSCFTSREVHIVDVMAGRTVSVVPNLSGPFELVLDGPNQRLYVADFRSSVIRIVDLTMTEGSDGQPSMQATKRGTIGSPKILQELR